MGELVTREVTLARKLVALGADPANENEARTAAVQACRLIMQHGMVLIACMPEPPRPPPPPPPPHGYGARTGAPVGRRIRARYDSVCDYCEGPIYVGDLVWWVPGARVVHFGCRGR